MGTENLVRSSRFKVGRESYVKLYDETFASERKREREGLPGFIEERPTVLVCVGFYFRVRWVVNKASSTVLLCGAARGLTRVKGWAPSL